MTKSRRADLGWRKFGAWIRKRGKNKELAMSLFSTFLSRHRSTASSTEHHPHFQSFIRFLDPLGPLFAGLLVLALAIAAIVNLSGCGEILPLLPSATIVSVSPDRVRPGETFVVTTRVTPDISACLLTAFGERLRCSVEASTCSCTQTAPIAVGGVVTLRVDATTSNGVAEAKETLIVDGAPPAVDGSRVVVVRNPVGVREVIEAAAGAVVDRPFTAVSGTRFEVFGTSSPDAELLAEGAVRDDGSFGPVELRGTEELAPGRIFVVVTDDLGNESAPIEIAGARDEVGPTTWADKVAIARRPIGALDLVVAAPGFVEKDDGCAMHSMAIYRLDQDPRFDTPLAQTRLVDEDESRVELGTPTESLPTVIVTVTDKCGNQSFPLVVEEGADADVPTVDLRIVEAKVTSSDSVRVLGGPGSVFDDTSSVREIEVYVDDTLFETLVPNADGSFVTTLEVERAEEIGSVSFLVVDKVGRRTVRIRVAALTVAVPPSFLDVVVPATSASAEQLVDQEATIGAVLSDAAAQLLEADGDVVQVIGGEGSDAGFHLLSPTASTSGAPRQRLFASGAYDPVAGHFVVLGGVGGEGVSYTDSWRFVDEAWVPIWADAFAAPPFGSDLVVPGPRHRAQMTYSSSLAAIVLFGGEGEGDGPVFLDDTWTFTAEEGWHRLDVSNAPASRAGASLFEDPVTGHLILFGGECPFGPCDDVWEFDGLDWRLHDACADGAAPIGRSGAQVAFDPVRGQVILFGGRRGGLMLDDTWVYDGSWREIVSPFRPSPRAGGALFFDPSLRLVVLHGGEGSIDEDERFWGFVDEGWAAINTAGPPPPQRAWGVTSALPRPTIGFGIASNATFFFPQSDLWEGQVQNRAGTPARLRVAVARPPIDAVSARLIVDGGGTAAGQDGYAVYIRRDDNAFEPVGLSSAVNASQAFVLPNAALSQDEVVILLESRGPTTDESDARLTIDAIRIEWSMATAP